MRNTADRFDDEDEDSGSTELAEVLPDVACGLLSEPATGQRSRENEEPCECVTLCVFASLREIWL
jgi:hypothetical protein